MSESEVFTSSTRWDIIYIRGSRIILYLYELTALFVFVAIPISAIRWLRIPPSEISLQLFPTSNWITYLIPYLVGLIYLLSSLLVLGLHRRDADGHAFVVFATSAAITIGALFDTLTTHRLAYLWTLALALTGGGLVNLAMLFPHEEQLAIRIPYLRWIGYIPVLLFALFAFPYNSTRQVDFNTLWKLDYIYTGIACLFFLGWTAVRRYTSPSPIAREQARLVMWGAFISFIPITIWFLISIFFPKVIFTPFLLLPMSIFPIAIAYAILRHRMLNTDYLLSRAVIYGLLAVCAVGGYALLVSGLTIIFGSAFQANSPLVIGVVSFIVAILLYPLRGYLQKLIDSLFSRSQAAYRERLQAFSRELTRAMELPIIIGLLRQYIHQILLPTQVHIFLHDPLSDHYIATADGSNHSSRPTSDLRFSTNSPLVQVLSNQRTSIFYGETTSLPVALQSEKTRLVLLASQLFVPLPGRQRLTGWLALGPRRSGEPYGNRDLEFLEAICDQAALAVERAQVVGDLERRIHEMNVLTRVSQGINVTLAFDDILELIYAQTSQVISGRDFRITLCDNYSDILYHVFYLNNDERIEKEENHPLPVGQGMEQEVIKSRRPVITDDYERECRSRGVLPSHQGIYAWLGVPLNTGAETIGVISLGSRDPAVTYTDEQVNLLQAIADQAAGAIVKARLLQESERRTRQLTSLNEVARSLTSTLALEPLLNQILQNAVDILNCEAGSLLLVDNQTDELVFELTNGPVAQDLAGKRLPPGTGLVGKAVNTRQPIIANDVRRNKEWFDKPDEQTGFTTNDLLVVPMLVKDHVTGVIEVINRRDGLPFTPDDQELLAAFTSQAAVAIENARLYTLTDQTLAARVEELSVMQRIDRELNASLDVSRAMRITLVWAMRQSKVSAGLVGFIDKSEVRVMAAQGYITEQEYFKDSYLSMELPALKLAIQSGQPQCVYASEGKENFTLLNGGQAQVVIPIRREAVAIGIILLESNRIETFSEETLAFLSRLSDHAAIAIANAQLYAEVQAANLAKSDFVSFVSHELKTPMTSIKGFTDLLAGGVVGPINDTQANFLNTIRSNVDRMTTLVSDLADISRIEAGRLRLDFEAVSVSEVIDEVVRSTRAQIEEKEQALDVHIPSNLPPMWGDRTRLIQILTNLVNNAYKYTPQKGHIEIITEQVDNRWDPNGAKKVIHTAVRDNGYGINPEDQKKIFQKFFRSDDQKIRDIPGTGLGLNITKILVEMQGGRIWFESEPHRGTTFHYTIPIVETA